MNWKEKDSLTRILLDDLKNSANLSRRKIINGIIDLCGYRPAGWMAELLARIDEQLNETSLHETAERAINSLSDGLIINNPDAIPNSGPLLVTANHPGFTDILAILACLKRDDVKIVAQQKGFMAILRNINRHMLTIHADSVFKLEAIREIIQALNKGMVVVIFPKGLLEPDPAIIPGAIESLEGWSDSIGIFLSKAPETRLLPILVSGVLTEKAWKSRYAKLGWNQKRRQQFAMAAQFIAQRFSNNLHWKRPLRIDIGQPKRAEELDPALDANKLNLAVKKEMLKLIRAGSLKL